MICEEKMRPSHTCRKSHCVKTKTVGVVCFYDMVRSLCIFVVSLDWVKSNLSIICGYCRQQTQSELNWSCIESGHKNRKLTYTRLQYILTNIDNVQCLKAALGSELSALSSNWLACVDTVGSVFGVWFILILGVVLREYITPFKLTCRASLSSQYQHSFVLYLCLDFKLFCTLL